MKARTAKEQYLPGSVMHSKGRARGTSSMVSTARRPSSVSFSMAAREMKAAPRLASTAFFMASIELTSCRQVHACHHSLP